MPDAALIQIAISMGKTPQGLLDALADEPEYWRERFWIYVNSGGR